MKKKFDCPLEATLYYLRNKWVVLILRELYLGTKRFGELDRNIGGISPKVLRQQLRQLERIGLVSRQSYSEIPPRVEYTISDKGLSLKPILIAMSEWGRRNGIQNENC